MFHDIVMRGRVPLYGFTRWIYSLGIPVAVPVVKTRVPLHFKDLAGQARVIHPAVRKIRHAHVGSREQLDLLSRRPNRDLPSRDAYRPWNHGG